MERSTEPKATSDGARLNRVQMARALREGAGADDGRGAEQRMASVERNWSMDGGLRRVGASVTLGVLLASTLTGGRITALRADFLQHATAGGGQGGSIPGGPGPSVGSDGQGHSPIQDTNQEQQKKMFSKLTGVTAAIAVGASVTVAGAQNAAVQWKVSEGGNGHWYAARAAATGEVAEQMAAAAHGHLATLTTQSENAFAAEVVRNGHFGRGIIGLLQLNNQAQPDAGWYWVTGEPLEFTNWTDFGGGLPFVAPDDTPCACCPVVEDNQCNQGMLDVYAPQWFGKWDDLERGVSVCGETWNHAALIEWSADCNSDGIVDYGQCLNGTLPDYNGNNIPDCCDRGEACVVGNFPVQWKVSDGGNGHWYMLDLSRRPWTGAADRASALGGHLVTVNSYAEHVFLRSSVFTYCCSMSDTWMGATRSSTDEEYHWVTGEQFAPVPEIYFNNNSAGWDAPALYLEQVIRFSWVGEWGGESNSANEGNFSVVEWSADCNNDGIVDYGQILTGQLSDANSNGVPDTCEFVDCNHDGIADSEQVARGQLPDYDGNNIPDCCDRGEACVVGSYPVQWRTASGGNGHWYQSLYVGPDPTHSEAVAVASSRGAYLATMNAQKEQAVCVKILQHSRAAEVVGGAWFGLVQDRFSPVYSEPSGGWVWGDGPVLFTNWASGEPSNDCFGAAEDFANIRPDGRWNDLNERPNCVGTLPGGVVNSVLLEWSADCNNDGTVDYGQILRGELPDINHNGTPDTCECIGDIYVDRAINGADLGALLAYWGPTTSAAASRACDLNGDGVVNGSDLGILLAYWGPCSN